MKLVIEIPEKTNAHIRSDYGHGIKCFRNADREILCDAIYHGTPYEERLHGKWKNGMCTNCGAECFEDDYMRDIKTEFCHRCGADMRKKVGDGE